MTTCPLPRWSEAAMMDCTDFNYMLGDFIQNCGGGVGSSFVWQEDVALVVSGVERNGPYMTVEAFDVDEQQDVTIVLKYSSTSS